MANLSPQKKTILAVDDDESILMLLSKALETGGFLVLTAKNGQVALDVLAREHVDLMMLDYLMPVKDGRAVLDELPKLGKDDLPVIILTSKGEKEVIVDTMTHGAVDFIVKPVNPATLVDRISPYLHEFSEADIKQILTMLRFPDMSLLRIPQIAREAGTGSDVYLFMFGKYEFIAMIPHEIKPTALISHSMFEVSQKMKFYVKGTARWFKVWPRNKDIAHFKKELHVP